MSNDEDDGDGFRRRGPAPGGDSEWSPLGDHDAGQISGGAPGKRSLTQGIRAADPRVVLLAKLRTVRGQISGVRHRHLPSMSAAIDSRDINGARDAATHLGTALATIDRELDEARQLATGLDSDGGRAMVEGLTIKATSLHADADPVLALAPPAARKLPALAAFAVHLFLDDLTATDATEAEQHRQWLARLDARKAPPEARGAVIDASSRFGGKSGRSAATIDKPAEWEESRATVADPARVADRPVAKRETAQPDSAREDRAAATIDKPAEYEETRATIDGSPAEPAIAESPKEFGRPDRAAATIDKPAEYEETRATIDDSARVADRVEAKPDRPRPDRPRQDRAAATIDKPAEYEETRATIDDSPAEPAVAESPKEFGRPDRAAAAIDKPAEYEESRATIDDSPDEPAVSESAKELGRPDRGAATIDMPAEYEDTRATIDDSPDEDDDSPDPACPGGKRKRRRPQRPGVLATLRKGGANAAEPLPAAVRRQLEATLGTDLGRVRVHRGAAAASLADAHGAQAFAFGDDIVLGAGHDPHAATSFELLAHEVAHTVQQRGGAKRIQRRAKDGAPETAEERAADVVAMKATSQRDAVTAGEYVERHEREIGAAIRGWMETRAFALPHPSIAFTDDTFGRMIAAELAGESLADRVRGGVTPTSLHQLVDDNRPLTQADTTYSSAVVGAGALTPTAGFAGRTAADIGPRGPLGWSPSVGFAIAAVLEERIREGLGRMAPRFALVLGEHQREAAQGTALADVREHELMPSHPADRLVRGALCAMYRNGSLISVREGDDVRGAGAAPDQAGIDNDAARRHRRRPIRGGTWQGGTLWNWVRVEQPADATAEEVAAHYLDDPAQASRIREAAPMFGLPEDLALRVPEAAARHPRAVGGARPEATVATEQDPTLMLAMTGGVSDDQALLQSSRLAAKQPAGGAGEAAPAASVDTTMRDMDLSVMVLQALAERLAPFGAGPLVINAVVWLSQRRAQILSGAADGAAWAAQARQQRQVVGWIVADVDALVAALIPSGAEIPWRDPVAGAQYDRQAAAAVPRVQRDILAAYARAASVSHLPETAATLLAEARLTRTLAIARSIEEMLAASITAVETLEIPATSLIADMTSPSGELEFSPVRFRTKQAQLRQRCAQLRSRLLTGQIDQAEIAALFQEVDQLRVESSLAGQLVAVEQLIGPLGEMDSSLWDDAFDLFASPGVDALSGAADPTVMLAWGNKLRSRLAEMVSIWRSAKYEIAAAATEQRVSTAQLAQAVVRTRLAELASSKDIQIFLSRAIDSVEDANTKALLMKIAVILGLSLASAGVGNFTRGYVMGSTGSAALAGLAEVTATAFTQALAESAIMGNSFADTLASEFVWNLVANGAMAGAARLVRGRPKLAGLVDDAADIAKESYIGKRGLELTAKVVFGAGVQYMQQQFNSMRETGRTLTWTELGEQGVQGMAMMLGTGIIGNSLTSIRRLETVGAKLGRQRQTDARMAELAETVGHIRKGQLDVRALATTLEETGDRELAVTALRRERELLRQEQALYEALAGTRDQGGFDEATLDTLRGGAEAHLGKLIEVEATGIAATLALDEIVPGKSYAGTTEQTTSMVAHYRRVGMTVDGEQGAGGQWSYRVKDRNGEPVVEILERPRDGRPRDAQPATSDADADKARQYAADAQEVLAVREAAVKAQLDPQEVIDVDRVQVGFEFAGIVNQASQPARAGKGGDSNDLVLFKGPGPMSTRGSQPVGQGATVLDAPGVRVSEQQAGGRFAESAAVQRSFAVGQLEVQTPFYRAEVVKVERRPTGDVPGDWESAGKAWRLTIQSDAGAKRVYAASADITAGPGPASWGPVESWASPDDFARLKDSGGLLLADDPAYVTKIQSGGGRVLVVPGSAAGAWGAEGAAGRGAQADWMANLPKEGDASPHAAPVRQQLDQILDQLWALADDDVSGALELVHQVTTLPFRGAATPRNADVPGAAFDHPNVNMELGTPTKLEPLPGGKVRVTLDTGEVRVYDQVITSFGQNPALPGGPGALLGPGASAGTGQQVPAGTIALRPVWNGEGELVALESADPAFPLTLKGASYASPKMAPWVAAEHRPAFVTYVHEIGERLRLDSRGVSGGFEAQGKRIPLANEVAAARNYYLPGESGTLRLDGDNFAAWEPQLKAFLAAEMRTTVDRIQLEPMTEGRSGATVLRVTVGKNESSVLKIVGSMADAQAERDMLLMLRDKGLSIFEPVRPREVVSIEGGGAKAGGAVLTDVAEGKTVEKMAAQLPADVVERAAAIESLKRTVKTVAQGLAEMHAKFATGQEMAPARKMSDAGYLLADGKLGSPQVRNALGADFSEVQARIAAEVVPAFIGAKVPETVNLGDANNGNFVVSSEGKVQLIDVGLGEWSLDGTDGTPRGTGAADIARFLESFETREADLSPAERAALRQTFEAAYAKRWRAEQGAAIDMAGIKAAERFYRVDMLIGLLRSDEHNVKALAELRLLLGIGE